MSWKSTVVTDDLTFRCEHLPVGWNSSCPNPGFETQIQSTSSWLNSLGLSLGSLHSAHLNQLIIILPCDGCIHQFLEVTDCYGWRGNDEVNGRPVGKPQEEGMMNIAASFSHSKKPKFVGLVGKSQTQEGDAC
jgi:hypothetical protein